MATYRNPMEFQRAMAQKANELRKNDIRTPSKAATFLQATAIKLAPRGQTGETIKGIKKSKKKRGYQVVSRVTPKGSKGFRQNFWTNRSAPHRTIIPRWSGGKKTVYGDGSHITTGMPRWWHFATLRTRAKFKELYRLNTKKALRAGV